MFEKVKHWLKSVLKRQGQEGDEQRSGLNKHRILIVFLGILCLGILLSGATLKATSTPTFCSSCHEMAPEYATWQVTSHNKIACVTCHIEPGVLNLVKHKIGSMGQLYEHVTNKVPNPVTMPHPINNEVCEQCHSTMRKVTASGDIIIPHDKHLSQGIKCVACHAGVAHGFVAERGLAQKADYVSWTKDKAEQAIKFDDTKLAMELCFDCHEQVQAGKKPWLTNEGQGKSETDRVKETTELQAAAASGTAKLPQAKPIVEDNGKPAAADPPTINCQGCHSAMKTPDSHREAGWGTTHGLTARKDVRYCASCHSRQRERVLLKATTDVRDYVMSNAFCVSCHLKRPSGHLASKALWLPAHPQVVAGKGADGCLVCHDIQKSDPKQPSQRKPSANPVYCNQCHWFQDKVTIKSAKQ